MRISMSEHSTFVELGALHKLLDRLKPDDSECTNAWYSSSEPCCKEIILRFTNLLNKWASDENKVDYCLATDHTLTKCQHCGVIKSVESSQVQDDGSSKRKADDATTIEKFSENSKSSVVDGPTVARKNTIKQEIMRNSHPIVPPCCKIKSKNNFKSTIRSNENKKIIGANSPIIIDEFSTNRYRRSNRDAIDKCLTKNVESWVRESLTAETAGDDGSQRFSNELTPSERTYFRNVAGKTEKKIILPLGGIRDEIVDAGSGSRLLNDRSRPEKREIIKCDTFGRRETSALSRLTAENMIRQWTEIDCDVRHINVEEKILSGKKNLKVINNIALDNSTTTHPSPDKVGMTDEPDTPDSESMTMFNNHKPKEISKPMTTTIRDEQIASKILVSSSYCNRHQHIRRCKKLKRYPRQIFNENLSFDNDTRENAIITAASKVLFIYRNILESKEQMDWSSFEHLVSGLHPSHRELWRDICNAVSKEAKRVAAETGAITEVCIEINPTAGNEITEDFCYRDDEISFELDMTLI